MLTYNETLEYLDSFLNYEAIGLDNIKKDFNLDKLRIVLERLGNPHRDYRCVHIAGTKGKGSICEFTSSILEEAGYRVGLFTSPHLDNASERIKINNKAIGNRDLVHVVNYLHKHLGSSPEKEFTFFEIYTLMAILYFSMEKVDFAVFEVGVGGRLDATNVIHAEVCGISPISYDHMQLLGRKIGQIAREKSAIIKRGAHCVSSPQRVHALRAIKDRCKLEGASLSIVGKDITYRVKNSSEEGNHFDIHSKRAQYGGCRTGMLGDFQVSNCATAVGICEYLLKKKKPGENTFKKGIERTFVPGRMEILCRQPLIVIDGAQNVDSAMRLKYSVEQIFKYDKLILLLGLSRDKDIKGVCRQLVPIADEIVLTRSSVSRAADPYIIKGYIKGRRSRITKDVKEALGAALSLAGKKDIILATGSFFLISEVRKMILDK